MGRLRIPVLLAVLALAIPAAPPADAGDGLLFSAVPRPAERAADDHVRRERFVTVDAGLLEASVDGRNDASVAFNLFPDTVLAGRPLQLQRHGPGEFTWVGRIGSEGRAVVTVRGGVMVGHLADPARGTFTITPAGGGVHAIAEVDPATYRPEVDRPAEAAPGSAPAGRAEADASEPPVVTVLVVYTVASAAGMGGRAAVEALAANVVAQTNQAYLDSGVIHRLELAAVRQTSYREVDRSDINLGRLTLEDDGHLDEVHAWRDEAAADLVVLIVAPMANACGSAWIMVEADPAFSRQAFAVVSYDCALGNLSFAHETGHLFGANHEPGEAGRAIFRHAYAYVDCPNGFRTIMAYGTECGTVVARIPQFSSPDHPYQGLPAGDEVRDNARALNRTAGVVALFRSPVPTCAGQPATIVGTEGPDELEGTAGRDVIQALGGDDVIRGLAGNDLICGGDGSDTILPGAGSDRVYGGRGGDRIEAGAGIDGLIDGGMGRDVVDFSGVTAAPVVGDLAAGEISAGTGTCRVRRVEGVVGSALADVIRGDEGANLIWGGGGNDRLSGRGGDDVLRAGPGDDRVRGGAGDDRLYGEAGADALRGGAGQDLLYGDPADPVMTGGPGGDLCAVSGGVPAAC